MPPEAVIIAPAMGGPVNVAKLFSVNTMPILTPVFLMSLVRLVNPAGNKLWVPPAVKPYTAAQMYIPVTESTPIQAKTEMAPIVATGMNMLRIPTLSAR